MSTPNHTRGPHSADAYEAPRKPGLAIRENHCRRPLFLSLNLALAYEDGHPPVEDVRRCAAVISERDKEPKGLRIHPRVRVEVHRHVRTFAHLQHLLRRHGQRGGRSYLSPGLLPEAPCEESVDCRDGDAADRNDETEHGRERGDEDVVGFDPGQRGVHCGSGIVSRHVSSVEASSALTAIWPMVIITT